MPVYTRPHKRKLIKRSRTLPIYGEGEDKDKYFHCWNCGFVCNTDRDELGNSESSAGDDHTDYHQGHHCSTYDSSSDASRYAVLGGDTGHYQVAINIDTPDAVAKTIRHEHVSDISRGCPFCGSTNYRGDY